MGNRRKRKVSAYIVRLDKFYVRGPLKGHTLAAEYKFNDASKATAFINQMKEAERTVSITTTELDYSKYPFVPDRVRGESR